ncbi:MAG: hypothetical protein U5L04_09155 [Trueperaceae bacterium]|nr:hypothetical protein [Trueperaceae bacterium]
MSTLVATFDEPQKMRQALDKLYEKGFADEEVKVVEKLEQPSTTAVVSPIAGSSSAAPVDPSMSTPAGTAGEGGDSAGTETSPAALIHSLRDELPGVELDQDEASYYAQVINDDGRLIAVQGERSRLEEARSILDEAGASTDRVTIYE